MDYARYLLKEFLYLILIALAWITYDIFYFGVLVTLIDCGFFLLGVILSTHVLNLILYIHGLFKKLPIIYFKRFFQTNLLIIGINLALACATLFGFTIAIPMMLEICCEISIVYFYFVMPTSIVSLFHFKHLRALIWEGHLSIDEYVFVIWNPTMHVLFFQSNVRTLFQNKIITLDQLRTYNQTTSNALENEAIYNDLLHKRITWDQIPLRYAQLTKSDQIRINQPQSTHTASVHDSISESAKKLSEQFNKQLNVTPEINNLKEQITNFQPNTHISDHQKQAALRSFERSIKITDRVSGVSYNQLIALTFVAAKNDDCRDHTYNDYLEAIILALYEVQRGYNLNAAGIDDMIKDDMPICASGSFNKIIEKMVGILPDCEIKNINSEIIYLKLFSTIKSEIINLFKTPNTVILPESTESTNDSTLLDEILIKDASCNQQQPLKTKLINNIKPALEEKFGDHLNKVTTDDYSLDDFISDGLENKDTVRFLHDEIKKQQNLKTDGMVSDVSIFGENTSNTEYNYNGLNRSPT